MVHTDGRLTTCCLDEHMENALGNLTQRSLNELWHGQTMQRWRQAQIEGRFEDSGPYCTRCNWRSAGAYPPEKVAAYLRRIRGQPRCRPERRRKT